MDNTNIDLIRSHMDTIILRTLQNSDKYGLEILNEIKSLSDDLYTVKQPTLYSSLKRLESQGLVLSCPGEETKGANRTYYRLTDEGRAFLEADQSQWEFARTIIDKLLSDKVFDKDAEKPFEPSDYRPLTKRTKKETEEKVVVKYVEVEKPVYIDRQTGQRIDNYSPDQNNEEDFSENVNSFAVYDNQNEPLQETKSYSVENEIVEINKIATEEIEKLEENQEIASDIIEENQPIENDIQQEYAFEESDLELNDEYNNYHISSTQITEDDYYSDDYKPSNNGKYSSQSQINHNDYIDNDIDYIGMIEDVISSGEQTTDTSKNAPTLIESYEGEITMAELKQSLAKKNITLKSYQKNNSITYYSGKFYYSNKLLRDWSWITYAVYLLFLILSYGLGKDNGIQWTYILGFAIGGVVLPAVCTFFWSKSPLRKKRNNLTLNNAMLSAFILMIAFFVLILIIAFFAAQIDTTKPTEFVPALVVPSCSLLLLPLAVVIYAMLFKIKNYHLK